MPKLLQEIGVKRLNEFLQDFQKHIKPTAANADDIIRNTIYSTLSKIKDYDDHNDLETHKKFFFNDFLVIDSHKNTYTPTLSTNLKEAFNLYLKLLTDVRDNWSSYIPVLTRIDLSRFNVFERLEQAIKYMTIEKNLFKRREKSEQTQVVVNDLVQGIKKLEQSLFDSPEDTVKNYFSEVHKKVGSIPFSFELPTYGYKSSREYFLNYDHVNIMRPSPTRFTFLEKLIELEIKLNEKRIELNQPLSTTMTDLIRPQLSAEKITEFDDLVKNACSLLDSQLAEYRKTNVDQQKRELAGHLLYLLRTLTKVDPETKQLDSASLCSQARFHLQHFQLMHSAIIIKRGIGSSDLGEILDKALVAFTQRENIISIQNNLSLAEKVCRSLELIERATSPFYSFKGK